MKPGGQQRPIPMAGGLMSSSPRGGADGSISSVPSSVGELQSKSTLLQPSPYMSTASSSSGSTGSDGGAAERFGMPSLFTSMQRSRPFQSQPTASAQEASSTAPASGPPGGEQAQPGNPGSMAGRGGSMAQLARSPPALFTASRNSAAAAAAGGGNARTGPGASGPGGGGGGQLRLNGPGAGFGGGGAGPGSGPGGPGGGGGSGRVPSRGAVPGRGGGAGGMRGSNSQNSGPGGGGSGSNAGVYIGSGNGSNPSQSIYDPGVSMAGASSSSGAGGGQGRANSGKGGPGGGGGGGDALDAFAGGGPGAPGGRMMAGGAGGPGGGGPASGRMGGMGMGILDGINTGGAGGGNNNRSASGVMTSPLRFDGPPSLSARDSAHTNSNNNNNNRDSNSFESFDGPSSGGSAWDSAIPPPMPSSTPVGGGGGGGSSSGGPGSSLLARSGLGTLPGGGGGGGGGTPGGVGTGPGRPMMMGGPGGPGSPLPGGMTMPGAGAMPSSGGGGSVVGSAGLPPVGSPNPVTTVTGGPASGPAPPAGGGGGGGLNGSEDVIALPHRVVTHVIGVQAIGAVSWRGRSPNAFKINQDAVLVAEHAMSGSLLVAVLDGHGQLGREVSQFLRERLPAILFTDDRFLKLRAPPPPSSNGGGPDGSPDGEKSRWSIKGKGAGGDDDEGKDNESEGSGSPGHSRGGRGGARAGRGGAKVGSSSSSSGASGAPGSTLVNLSPSALAEARQLTDILADALAAAEAALLNSSGINCTLSGSTAAVLLIRNGVVHLVNVGDSRAVLSLCSPQTVPVDSTKLAQASGASTMTGNLAPGGGVIGMPLPPGAGQPNSAPIALHQLRAAALASETCFAVGTVKSKMLTVDHKPETPRERQRITASGGRVMATRIKGAPHLVGPPRVWLKNAPLPGLNMSRSLGDLVAKQAGVISVPYKTVHVLQPSDKTLVVASDGLWDWVPNDEAAAVAVSTTDTWESSTRLARLARSRWLTRTGGADDTTVVVIRLGL